MVNFFKLFQPVQLNGGEVRNLSDVLLVCGIVALNLFALFATSYTIGFGFRLGLAS